MFGRSASLTLLLLLFSAGPALARSRNFFTGSPLGLGFKAGIEKRPQQDFLVHPQKTDGSYGRFYAFEPFLDFGNFIVRASGALHSYPNLAAAGSDGKGAFEESSDASSFAYGVQLLLVPFYSGNFLQRMYILVGGSNVSTSLKNVRTYSGGLSYTEKAKGGGQEYMAGLGYEFFFVQSYSVQLEAGYRKFSIDKFTYANEGDLSGNARTQGETVVDSQTGLVKKLHNDTPYFSLSLNLNF